MPKSGGWLGVRYWKRSREGIPDGGLISPSIPVLLHGLEKDHIIQRIHPPILREAAYNSLAKRVTNLLAIAVIEN
jgi:hypothetical protein